MKYLKLFESFNNTKLHVNFESPNEILIEEIKDKENIKVYTLNNTIENVIEWYIEQYGRSTYNDHFTPDEGHSTKDWNMSNEEIEELINTHTSYLREFCLAHKNEWMEI